MFSEEYIVLRFHLWIVSTVLELNISADPKLRLIVLHIPHVLTCSSRPEMRKAPEFLGIILPVVCGKRSAIKGASHFSLNFSGHCSY